MPIIAITTSSSTSVNAGRDRNGRQQIELRMANNLEVAIECDEAESI
jgi:hypothetical protein